MNSKVDNKGNMDEFEIFQNLVINTLPEKIKKYYRVV